MSILHSQGNGACTGVGVFYLTRANRAALELTEVDDVCINRAGGDVGDLIAAIVETGVGQLNFRDRRIFYGTYSSTVFGVDIVGCIIGSTRQIRIPLAVLTLNKSIAFSIFGTGRSKGNAAVAHRNIFSQFNVECPLISISYDTDVIGGRKFTSTAKDVEGCTIYLGDCASFRLIIAGELQINITNSFIHVALRSDIADFKGCIVVTGKFQRIVFKFPFFNVGVFQAVDLNFMSILHRQGNGACTGVGVFYLAGANRAAFELTQVNDIRVYRTGSNVGNLIATIVETGIG